MQLAGLSLLLFAGAAGMAVGPAPGLAVARPGAERRVVAAGAGKERRAQFASWDEVNVIAHGLLQLGHGLKEHVDRTKGQMRELGSRLSAHNSSMGRLLRQAREAQERGERLRASVRELEGRGRQLLNLSEALRQRLEEVAADKAEIQGRLEQLEGRVRLALQARPAENQSAKDLGALQVSEHRGQRRGTRPGSERESGPGEPNPAPAATVGSSPRGAGGPDPPGNRGSDLSRRGDWGTRSDLRGEGRKPDPPSLGGSGKGVPAFPGVAAQRAMETRPSWGNGRGWNGQLIPPGTRGSESDGGTRWSWGHWEHP